MKKPDIYEFYLGDLAVAAQVKLAQLETWIARRDFVPVNRTVPGRSRMFTTNDASRAAIMAFVINRCGLPVPVGAYIADMLHGEFQQGSYQSSWSMMHDLFDPDLPIFLIIYPDAAHRVKTRRPGEEAHGAVTFGVRWEGAPGSVIDVLRTTDPIGATVINLTRLAREARDRLAKHIDELDDDGYDEVEE